MAEIKLVIVPGHKPIRILQWLVKKGETIKYGTPLAVYRTVEDPTKQVKAKEVQLKSKHAGTVKMFLLQEGQVAISGGILLEIEGCSHPVVMKDMCAECGQDLRNSGQYNSKKQKHKPASVSMIPSIPELRISAEQAEEIAQQDKSRLHRMRKLVLLVDLDQTLIHTTQDPGLAALCQSKEDFYTFQLSKNDPTLFTKLRPHCREFLKRVAQCYELQIVTFGSRQYAHKIADFIDKEKKYFAHRILSRDECIHPFKKSGNLRHLFPCGDSMVCIIDDRDDVWSAVPNLIVVKKYNYFQGTGDINNPLKQKTDNETPSGGKVDSSTHSQRKRKSATKEEDDSEAKRTRTIKKVEPKTEQVSEKEEESPDDVNLVGKKNALDSNENNISLKIDEDEEDDKQVNVDDDLSLSSDSDSSSSSSSSSSGSSNSASETESKPCLKKEKNDLVKEDGIEKEDDNVKSFQENGKKEESPITFPEVLKNRRTESSLASAEDGADSSADTFPESSQSSVPEKVSSHGQSDKEKSGLSVLSQEFSDLSSQESINDCREKFRDEDDYLRYLQDILLQIHRTYYEAYDKYLNKEFKDLPDVRGVVPFLRSKVLYGCCLVLTGVIPQGNVSPPHHHKACIVAWQLGARIEEQITDKTTHLIAAKKGTAKYQDVKKRTGQNIHLVSVDWLWCCSERWERVSEKLFPVPEKFSTEPARDKMPPRQITQSDNNQAKQNLPKVQDTYDPITGKLMKKVKDARFNFMVEEANRRRQKQRTRNSNIPIYSSLKVPDAVVPIVPAASSNEKASVGKHFPLTKSNTAPVKCNVQARSRKRSMAETVAFGYSLSTDDIADMDKEVDDLLESSESEEEADPVDQGMEEADGLGKSGSDSGGGECVATISGVNWDGDGDDKVKREQLGVLNQDEFGTLIELPGESPETKEGSDEDTEVENEGDKESSDEYDEMDEWLKKEMPDFYKSDDEEMDVENRSTDGGEQ